MTEATTKADTKPAANAKATNTTRRKKAGAKSPRSKTTRPKTTKAKAGATGNKPKAATTPKKTSRFDEGQLSKGALRKLAALRKSLGDSIADEAFAKWLAQESTGGGESIDSNVAIIEEALNPLMDRVRIPRGGAYAIRRGRGRFIVEPIQLPG